MINESHLLKMFRKIRSYFVKELNINTEHGEQMSDEDKALEALIKDIKIVAYARFNASRRLAFREYIGLLAISVASFNLIVLTISEKFYHISNIFLPVIGINISVWYFSTISSILILVISVALSSMKLSSSSQALYSSGLKLNEVVRKGTLYVKSDKKKFDALAEITDDYISILKEIQINHEDFDQKIAKGDVNKIKPVWGYWMRGHVRQKISLSLMFNLLLIAISIFSMLSIFTQVGLSLC